MKSFYYIVCVFSMIFMPLNAVETASLRFPVVLIEGTYLVEGIPGFLPNRISSLYGKYRSDDGGLVEAYASTETLYFSTDLWGKRKLGSFLIQEGSCVSLENDNKMSVLAVEYRISMTSALANRSVWHFFFVFTPEDTDSFKLAFITAFLDRTSFYFSSARYPADLSFPYKL